MTLNIVHIITEAFEVALTSFEKVQGTIYFKFCSD